MAAEHGGAGGEAKRGGGAHLLYNPWKRKNPPDRKVIEHQSCV